MATLSHFRPLSYAAARPNTRTPRLNRPSKSRTNPSPIPNPKPRPKPNLKTQIGSQATTFTRLPPKGEEFDSSTVVKLHDSVIPAKNPTFSQEPEEPEQPLGSDYAEYGGVDEEGADGLEWDDEDEIFFDPAPDSSNSISITEFESSGDEEELPDEEGEVVEVKEKGVPAVMRCFDRAKIYVKAGDGGNGVVAFRREKYVPYGGPSGGDGGKGGDVYLEVDGSMNSLLPFRKNVHFRAGRGGHGQGRKQAGAKGEDVVVMVAPGTVVREAGSGQVLLELMKPGERGLLLPGGRGGRGNASFKSGTNKVPKIAEKGELGAEM